MLKIIQYPHNVLRQPAQIITSFDSHLRKLADELLKTVVPDSREPACAGRPLGVGLAANQVGKLWQMFVMMFPSKKLEVIINPRILKSSKKTLSSLPQKDQFLEGCLSFPGFYGFVDRPIKIKVSYQTLTGSIRKKTLNYPHSSYFQHERDHLDGILFIDYIKKSGGQLFYGSGREKLQPVKNPF